MVIIVIALSRHRKPRRRGSMMKRKKEKKKIILPMTNHSKKKERERERRKWKNVLRNVSIRTIIGSNSINYPIILHSHSSNLASGPNNSNQASIEHQLPLIKSQVHPTCWSVQIGAPIQTISIVDFIRHEIHFDLQFRADLNAD